MGTFKSVIYNNGDKRGENPVFSILSDQAGFSLGNAKDRAAAGLVETIFILINGQQTPSSGVSSYHNECFGMHFTGSRRLGSSPWYGAYEVIDDVAVTAADLWRKYNERALILSILNPHYEWAENAERNRISLDNFYRTALNPIIDVAIRASKPIPRCVIAGFGRGAVFGYRLAQQFLADRCPVLACMSIDPFINKVTESILIREWAVRTGEDGAWKYADKQGAHLDRNAFPVLRDLQGVEKVYNVFQRHTNERCNFLNALYEGYDGALESAIGIPKGSAIRGATSLCAKGKGSSVGETVQMDLVNLHMPDTEPIQDGMLEVYRHVVFKTIWDDASETGLVPPPFIISIFTPTRPTPGDSVTVLGAGFRRGQIAVFDGTREISSVKVSDFAMASFTIPDDFSIGSHSFVFRKTNGAVSNALSMGIERKSGGGGGGENKTVYPVITGISPASIDYDAGVRISLSGKDFVAGAQVTGIGVGDVQVKSPSLVEFTAYRYSGRETGTYKITVKNPDGKESNAVVFSIAARGRLDYGAIAIKAYFYHHDGVPYSDVLHRLADFTQKIMLNFQVQDESTLMNELHSVSYRHELEGRKINGKDLVYPGYGPSESMYLNLKYRDIPQVDVHWYAAEREYLWQHLKTLWEQP